MEINKCILSGRGGPLETKNWSLFQPKGLVPGDTISPQASKIMLRTRFLSPIRTSGLSCIGSSPLQVLTGHSVGRLVSPAHDGSRKQYHGRENLFGASTLTEQMASIPLLPTTSTTSIASDPKVRLANSPPFEAVHAIYKSPPPGLIDIAQLHLPAVYHRRDLSGRSTALIPLQLDDPSSLRQYFQQHLSVARLNVIHQHLWFAGLPRCAQPLNNHIIRNRRFVVTERADFHLLWQKDVLYVMPLPAYLLDHEIWTSHLCHEQSLFELARGMLLSYIWLICSESDLHLAREAGLVPRAVDWSNWVNLVRATSASLPLDGSQGVNARYQYGELRLRRINWIYRFCSRTRNFTTLMRGYNYGYTTYGSFFERNTAWIVSAIVYITVVLTAMQVGLATKELQDNATFSSVSYGFSVFAVVAPIGGLALVLVLLLILIPFNLKYALSQRKKVATAAASSSGVLRH